MEEPITSTTEPKQPASLEKKARKQLKKPVKWTIIILVWIGLFAPYIVMRSMIYLADDGTLPGIEKLENPESSVASIVYSGDGVELGKYFLENRTNANFNELSPYLVDALIATEDERFYEHSGVDIRATGRVASGVLSGDSKGGGSTITQQLAKMLFPREHNMTDWELVKRKFKEWIIATRLEKNFTKKEIIAMYFNKFDFLNNAVGINSASMVYFGKEPIDLEMHEAAMLVGMAKNPAMFNPLRKPDTVIHRRSVVFSQMKKCNHITQAQYDSLNKLPLDLNYTRVDHKSGLAPYFRETLRGDVSKILRQTDFFISLYFYGKITPEGKDYMEDTWYDVRTDKPLDIQNAINNKAYQSVQVYNTANQYFQLKVIDADGDCKVNLRKYRYAKASGQPYDIYSDGLKIYTTLDSKLQKYAEYAVQEHLKHELQADFDKNNLRWKRPPFSNDLSDAQIDTIMNSAMYQSQMYKKLTGKVCANCERPKKYLITNEKNYVCTYCHHSEPIRTKAEIIAMFKVKRPMRVFDWQAEGYEKDTMMTAMDSIRYYKGLLRASMISMNPHNGHVKAWVGGPNFKHFKFDAAKKGKRQVGSTFKPFIYATALEMGAITPCTFVPDIRHCVEVPYNKYRFKQWCPGNAGAKYSGEPTPIPFALASSMNNITAYVIGLQDGAMPGLVYNRVSQLGIDTSRFEPVPSMALGVFDLSVFEMVGGMCSFVNDGIYVEPKYIDRIEDKNGNTIYSSTQKIQQVWSPETAYKILSIMKKTTAGIRHPTMKSKKTGRAVVGGTAMRIRGRQTEKRPYAGLRMPIAAKTGTTQNQSDGWFMGLTPDLVTGVWVGAEDRAVRFRSLQLGMGTNMALPMWAYYMHKVYEDSTINISQGDFEKPASVIGDPLDCLLQSKGVIDFDFEGDDTDWSKLDSNATKEDEEFYNY
jgi:penicillin-binding protein 1A